MIFLLHLFHHSLWLLRRCSFGLPQPPERAAHPVQREISVPLCFIPHGGDLLHLHVIKKPAGPALKVAGNPGALKALEKINLSAGQMSALLISKADLEAATTPT